MPTDPASTKVLVTGASGFIALHTVLRLLQLGYNVRGTTRTETQAKSTRESLSRHVDTSKLELICTDLLKDEGWKEAVNGCEFVLHLASPFPAEEPKHEDDLILPARDGTLRVLRAAHAGSVKRVVVVSSVAAVMGGHEGENRSFDESDWTDLQKCRITYSKSKTLAERAAWDFIQGDENRNKMEMVSVNPGNVLGPVLDSHYHTSVEWLRTLMRREVPGVSRTRLDLVDVRDVAEMIVQSMTTPAAAGNRFLAVAASVPLPEFAGILHRNFASHGYRVPTGVLPDVLVRLIALFTPKLRHIANQLNWNYSISTAQARSVLGWQPRPYEKTIVEMGESLIEHGLV